MTPPTATARTHSLSNGRYTAMLTPSGGGYSALDGLALTRWRPDQTRDADGFFFYLRDLDSGAVWSATPGPVPGAERTEMDATPGRVEFRRTDDGIEVHLEICVSPDDDVELRRLTLTNRSDRPRRVQVTSFAEVVLNAPAADAAHPMFSKLFVQTAFDQEREALVAWRRLRSPDDEPLWLQHQLWRDVGRGPAAPRTRGEEASGADAIEYETDRARFIGRGRSRRSPRALDEGAALTGTTGNVLDPIVSIRRTVQLAPGASASLVAVLSAGTTREFAEAAAARYTPRTSSDAASAVNEAFRAADERAVRTEEDASLHIVHTPEPTGDMRPASPTDDGAVALDWSESLQMFNGYGGFSADGTEYVIRLRAGASGPILPPQPWTNVIANERAGFVTSERGAACTWAVNSRENRITPWFNDPIIDPHGEALYVRDDDAGIFWSATPGPVPGPGPYEVRHGLGYTRFRYAGFGLAQDMVTFVAPHDPVKITRVRITNTSDRERRVSLFSYARLVLGAVPWVTRPSVVTRGHGDDVICATNPSNGEFSELVAFAAMLPDRRDVAVHATADRELFLGRYGDPSDPAALHSPEPIDGAMGADLDPCAAFQSSFVLAPGATAECTILLGEGADGAEVATMLPVYRDPTAVTRALADVQHFWRDLVGAVHVETPSPAIDLMVNGWLPYQALSCRVWGRTAYQQSGGAFGFRDQLQDMLAFVHLDPARTRAQIVLHAAHQFAEGDVLHWWHPPTSKGIRTRFSDDLLWLPYAVSVYVQATGDASVLEDVVRYVTGPMLDAGEDERFEFPEEAGTAGTVYDHCCRALDRSLTRGAHGLPLMGTGDWNDGMNRVGREGRGESVWLGFFLLYILEHFLPFVVARGDTARAEEYRAYLVDLRRALNEGGWDGAWYRRAYYDNGAPLGAASNDECRIDAIAQGWAVISGAAPALRADMALDALEQHLVSEDERIIRLLAPAFDRTPYDPGYIKGYLPGVRENGGQYTHGALWAVKALAEAGRCDRAARLLEMLSPVSHARTPEDVAVYQVEPYVIAADVYGVAPHVGRGGWTWYTGSASWMYRVALESVLGVELRGGAAIALRPCIPDDWPGFRLRYRVPGGRATYDISVRRAAAGEPTSARLDHRTALGVVDGAVVIPLRQDDDPHTVEITLGNDVGPRPTTHHA